MTQPTPEMVSLFQQRTLRHIELVRRNLIWLIGFRDLEPRELVYRANHHDRSKFRDSERLGYVWLNWTYHCQKNRMALDLTPEVQVVIQRALAEHRSRNRHHPDAHDEISDMRTLDIVEMICDWHAIALENETGPGSTAKWVREVGTKRWSFTPDQLEVIHEVIDVLENGH